MWQFTSVIIHPGLRPQSCMAAQSPNDGSEEADPEWNIPVASVLSIHPLGHQRRQSTDPQLALPGTFMNIFTDGLADGEMSRMKMEDVNDGW